MSTHNIDFYGDLTKMSFNYHQLYIILSVLLLNKLYNSSLPYASSFGYSLAWSMSVNQNKHVDYPVDYPVYIS